jgi:hypothetical protein
MLSGRQLEVSLADPMDIGTYTCVATNAAGQTKQNYELIVLGDHFVP